MYEKLVVLEEFFKVLVRNKMSAANTWILRLSVVLGMIVAVVAVLYFTPMPEHQISTCNRPCHELEWPMICRIKFNLEVFHTLSKACDDCPNNQTHCTNDHCIPADGYKRALLTANKKLPGPSIQVCKNDIIVVDVANQVPGHEFSIHWRGQSMQATPCMDGVPMITQCPISSFTTFQYKFRASSPGTHIWHAHSNSHQMDGIFGAFVVRQPDLMEPQRRMYDVDDANHVLIITEWNRKPAISSIEDNTYSLLINGRGNLNGYVPYFTVRKGLRYRFRIAYAAGANGCPVELKIEKHHLKVIALDGNPTAPYESTSVVLGRGERLDFILKANQESDNYLMRIISKCSTTETSVVANLVYEGVDLRHKDHLEDNEIEHEHSRVFQTDVCDGKLGKVCINDVQSLFVMPASLRARDVDHKLYLVFNHLTIGKYGADKPLTKIPRVNNITFTFPSSPLLTQYENIVSANICNRQNKPSRCQGHEVCECVHVEQIPLGSSVEIIFINQGDEDENIFHLHGYSFYVTAFRQFDESMSLEKIKDLDSKELLFDRNLKSPAHKDTIRIPKYGVVAIRFVADNPGFWMLRDEHARQWTRGLDLILQVGTRRDFQSIPVDFPRCGNWIGPEFFLV